MVSTFVSSTTQSSGRPATIAPNDHAVPNPGNDGVSTVVWSPTAANILASGNWDGGVRCWKVQQVQGTQSLQAVPKGQVNHDKQSPVLSTCFSPDGRFVISGGADNAVRAWNLDETLPVNTIPPQIGAHDATVQGVGYIRSTNTVVSGAWDRKLKFWDGRTTPNPVWQIDLPERVYSMDVRDNRLVVATAGRDVLLYDVTGVPQLLLHKKSPLQFQTRCVTCFPDSTGFAIGSIGGRVCIHYTTKVPGKDSYSFPCHRQGSNAYAVNGICFNPRFAGTFATCGSDGVVGFWDKDVDKDVNNNKQRPLKRFGPIQRTIPAANFNAEGNLFAYASSYEWSKGSMHVQPGNEIFIHTVNEQEVRPKPKKPSTGHKR